MAQLVEHILGKDEVPSSNLGSSSKTKNAPNRVRFFVLDPLLLLRIGFLRPAQNPVRLPRPKIGMLAYLAQGAGIFAIDEYLGSAHPIGCVFCFESVTR